MRINKTIIKGRCCWILKSPNYKRLLIILIWVIRSWGSSWRSSSNIFWVTLMAIITIITTTLIIITRTINPATTATHPNPHSPTSSQKCTANSNKFSISSHSTSNNLLLVKRSGTLSNKKKINKLTVSKTNLLKLAKIKMCCKNRCKLWWRRIKCLRWGINNCW